ncbi:hypothetical protein [Pseudocolwellia sp. HL-MZ7]|uniref:hypothetical protein n=1 Tax=Pseudocolwellia sp. HL-MZ7 TaxID=3400627 RepID=UPI003CF8DD1C
MKLSSKAALMLTLLSTAVIASEYSSPVENVEVYKTEFSTLSIQNLSNEKIEIDLYGQNFNLTPASGVQFECSGYDNLELQIKNNDHEYFEVPCKSRVVITELFTNQFMQGE